MNKLYELIKELRLAQGISDAELSRRAGIRHGLLSDLKHNENQVLKMDNLKKIADYFGIPVDFFLSDGEINPKDIPPELPTTESQLLFALYGEVPEEISDAEINEIKQYAEMVLLRKRNQKKGE